MEEADETLYWLGLIHRSGKINPGKLRDMMNEATELLAIFVASIKTAELDNGEKYERQSKKYKRKWEGQSSKDEQRPAIPKLCTSSFVIRTSSFVTRTSRCTTLNVRRQEKEFTNTTISLHVKGGFYDVTLVTENSFAQKVIFLE